MRVGLPGKREQREQDVVDEPGELVVGDGGAVDEEVVADKRGRQADELGQP